MARRRASTGFATLMSRLGIALMLVAMLLPLVGQPARAAGTATIDIEAVDTNGNPLPYTRLIVTDDQGTIYGPLETAPVNGVLSLEVEAGDGNRMFTVTVDTPPACGEIPAPQVIGPVAVGAAVAVQVVIGFTEPCSLGSIAGYAYACPSGTDFSQADYAAYRDGCTTPVNDETFLLSSTGSGTTWSPITGEYGVPGRAPVVGLQPGVYNLALQPSALGNQPPAAAFCLVYDISPSSGNAAAVNMATLQDAGTNIDLDNSRVACDFFLPAEALETPAAEVPTEEPVATAVPTEAPAEDIPTEPAAPIDLSGFSSLELHAAGCPVDYAGGDYFTDCHADGLEGITFTVTRNGSADYTTTLPAVPGPGVVYLDGLDGGTYTVNDDQPGSADDLFYYCSIADAADIVPFEILFDGSIRFEIPSGQGVVCDWYYLPQSEEPAATATPAPTATIAPGTSYVLDINAVFCPTGIDPTTLSESDRRAVCNDPAEDIGFLVDPDGVNGIYGVTDANGEVIFSNGLAAQQYLVSVDLPGEFVQSYVYCALDGSGSYEPRSVEGGPTIVDFSLNEQFDCEWYLASDDMAVNSTIIVRKALCPEGYPGPYYYKSCYNDVLPGTTIDATGPNFFEGSAVTNNSGVVQFQALAAGVYRLVETPPSGIDIDVYAVFCEDGEGNAVEVTYDEPFGVYIYVNVNQTVTCDWYNVPAVTGPSGSITVHTFLCQGRTDNKYNWEQDCVVETGILFILETVNGGELAEGTTNANGLLVFYKLDDGAYQLDQIEGSWCHAESSRVDAQGNVLVANGGNTDVYIYECTPKTITVLPATGTGSSLTVDSANAARGIGFRDAA